MRVAIIGPPGSGKSTIYTAVTGLSIPAGAAPEPRHAVVRVPEPRLCYLTELYQPKKVTEATMEFVDIPGCTLDAAKGQDEWRRLLPTVRQAEVLVVVVQDFAPVAGGSGTRNPMGDFAKVWDELIFADLDAVTTREDRLDKTLKKPSKTHDLEKRELTLLVRCREALETGAPLSTVLTSTEDRRLVSSFSFLTERPIVCVRNVSDDRISTSLPLELEHVVDSVVLSASIEAEIALLDPADRPAFLADLGLTESARDRLIRTCYRACGLISFLTMGPDEVRAWTIPVGATAVEAAAKIHTDLSRGFIRAETVSYDDLVAHKDMKGARAAGRVRKEGKTYVVADGDILNILANA